MSNAATLPMIVEEQTLIAASAPTEPSALMVSAPRLLFQDHLPLRVDLDAIITTQDLVLGGIDHSMTAGTREAGGILAKKIMKIGRLECHLYRRLSDDGMKLFDYVSWCFPSETIYFLEVGSKHSEQTE